MYSSQGSRAYLMYFAQKQFDIFKIFTVGLPLKFCSEKIPLNRLGMVLIILWNKVLIPCDSEYFGRVYSVTRNEMEWNKILRNNDIL
jgi:hypothetical protein